MRSSIVKAVVAGSLLAGLSALPTLAEFKLDGDPKVSMIIFGPKNDGGWSQAFDEARVRMEESMGTKIPFVDSIPENATAIRPPVELFIQKGYNIIIGSAFGYSDTFKELAEQYPNVAFLNGAGITNGPNLESFYGRTYETQYLCGMAAAAASKTGKLGFVAANPFGLVNWTVNAYELGAKQINPDATTTVIFTGAWNDPVKERAAAEALIEQGIDVIGQHVDTPAPQVVAQENGVYGTGHHRDMREFAPEATLCSSVWVWDRFLTPTIENIVAGGWETQPYGAFLSIAEGGTDIACCNDAVPQDVVDMVVAERERIVNGDMHVFDGPIMNQAGEVVVPEGEHPDDGALWGMDYLVEGVIGSLQ